MTSGTTQQRSLREAEYQAILDWDPKSSQRAEQSCDSGSFAAAGDLVEHIMGNTRVQGCLLQRTSVIRLPLDFSDGNAQFVKALKNGDWWRINPANEIKRLLSWYALLGIALGRLNWVDKRGKPRMRSGRYQPRVQCWSARNLDYDSSRDEWWCQTATGRELVTPGENGWILWLASESRPWVNASWRAVRAWTLLIDYATVDWAVFGEKRAGGVAVIHGPEADTDTKEKRSALATEFRKLGANGVIVMSEGWDYSIVEATANTWQTFRQQIEVANIGIAIALLGQNLTTEVSAGAYASTTIHKAVAAEIIGSDAEALSDMERDQVLVPIAQAQHGDPDAAPFPEYDTKPPEEKVALVDTWQKFGVFMKDVQVLGLPVDIKEAGDRAGIPWRKGVKDGDFVLKEPPTPPAPAKTEEPPEEPEAEPKPPKEPAPAPKTP
jgi:hypothetical protein